MIREEVWLGPGYATADELMDELQWYWSGSRFNTYGCWRKGQHRYEDGLEPRRKDKQPLLSGSAIHACLAYYYAMGGRQAENISDVEEGALDVLRTSIERAGGFPMVPPKHKYEYFSLGHLEIIMKFYFRWARKHDLAVPVTAEIDDLNLENVLGARFRMTPTGRIILGESAFIMRMSVQPPWKDEPVDYIYAGLMDLPIHQNNDIYVMDHKSTSGYLSKYWFNQFRVDNGLRVYAVMAKDLLKKLHRPIQGIMVNGLYVGARSSSVDFKGTRFDRGGPYDFSADSLREAQHNHCAIMELRQYAQEHMQGYAPQVPGPGCRQCEFVDLCVQSPRLRNALAVSHYGPRNARHLLQTAQEEDQDYA
jgi:hypothetical protein